MGFFSKLTQFGGWASKVASQAGPLVSMVNPAVGMSMTTFGGLGASAFGGKSTTGGAFPGIASSAFTTPPNLGIYSPPGGVPAPVGATSGPGVQQASIGSAAGALIKALSPAARALAARGVPWLRANWKWLASVVGSSILAELGQWMLASETKRHRRMNVLNPRALRRALRRTHGFASYAKRSITLERHGWHGVKFKKHRRRAA